MNPKHLPLNAAIEWQDTLNWLRNEIVNNADIIEPIEINDILLAIRDKEKTTDFSFLIRKFSSTSPKLIYNVSVRPYSSGSLTTHTGDMPIEGLSTYFNNWINLIRKFNLVSFSETKDFSEHYAQEIFSDFEIIEDETFDTQPYSDDVQEVLHEYLLAISERIQQEPDYGSNMELQEISNVSEAFAENIPNMTKRQILNAVAKLLGKIKTKGVKLFKEITNEVWKNAKSKIAGFIADKGPALIGQALDWLHSISRNPRQH